MTSRTNTETTNFDIDIGGSIGRFAQVLETETCRSLREKLKAADKIARMDVIKAAEAGDRDADYAMRELAIEYLDRRESMPAAFAQRALLRSLIPDQDEIEEEPPEVAG